MCLAARTFSQTTRRAVLGWGGGCASSAARPCEGDSCVNGDVTMLEDVLLWAYPAAGFSDWGCFC